MELACLLAGLIIVLAISFWIINPKRISAVVITSVINVFKENEAELVQRIYNTLPENLKKQIDSVAVAKLVDHFLNVIVTILEDVKVKK